MWWLVDATLSDTRGRRIRDRLTGMERLRDKRVLLGVTGGIAAYKAAELVRLLRGAGAEVQGVMTAAAEQFITPLTLQALSGRPVRRALFDPEQEAAIGHIELARWADAVLVAPASADFLARLRMGRADDLLATVCLATKAPIAVAPAMNRQMWAATATAENVACLRERGVHIFGPEEGDQACGETGPGRMREPAGLMTDLTGLFGDGPLAGKTVLVTAGPTREAIDPVRYLTNRSSGRMGFAVAAAAAEAGAAVTLVAGPVALATPPGVERVDVESAEEMAAAVRERDCDLFIGTAAVADYRPAEPAAQKLKRDGEDRSLALAPNPDILREVATRIPRPFTVGFAAETESVAGNARAKLRDKGVDLIAANRVGAGAEGGFETAVNALEVYWADGERTLPLADKRALARDLVALIAERLHE